jgi:hypothetical protein
VNDNDRDHRRAPGGVDTGLDGIHQFVQVDVPGNDFVKGIGNADDRPVHFPVSKAVGAQQRAVGRPSRPLDH